MNFSLPTDPHELEWLTQITINSHCSISTFGRSTQGFGVWYEATVSHLLAETRHAKGYVYGGTLLPLLGALSAIDQYGECYAPIVSTFPSGEANKSGIIKAAHNFLGIPLNSPDSDALYALRNSLMHQSSLISVNQRGKAKHYWFEIDNSSNGLFVHAQSQWDGKYNTRNNSNKTLVNASRVLELAVVLIDKLKSDHAQGQLKLELTNGLEELLTAYVQLDFETSFQESYMKYLCNIIDRSLNSPPIGAEEAQKVLAKVSPMIVEQAALKLSTMPGLGEEALAKLVKAFPSVKT